MTSNLAMDALLLLVEEAATDPVRVSAATLTPDPTQIAAVVHRNSPFQLQAGPGTGKTRTLVRRVESLLADGVDSDREMEMLLQLEKAYSANAKVIQVVDEMLDQILRI